MNKGYTSTLVGSVPFGRAVCSGELTAGELADVVGHPNEKSGSLYVIALLHMQLREGEGERESERESKISCSCGSPLLERSCAAT